MNKKNKELLIPFKEDVDQLKQLVYNFHKVSTIENLEKLLKFVYPGFSKDVLLNNYDKVLCGILTGKITEKIIFTIRTNSNKNPCAGYVLEDFVYYVDLPYEKKVLHASEVNLKFVHLQEITIINKFKI